LPQSRDTFLGKPQSAPQGRRSTDFQPVLLLAVQLSLVSQNSIFRTG
jgi:hypothetical protein